MNPLRKRGWFDLWRSLDSQIARSARTASHLVNAVARRRAGRREPETPAQRSCRRDPPEQIHGCDSEKSEETARGPPVALWHIIALGTLFVIVPELLCAAYWLFAITIAARVVWRFRADLEARNDEFY